MPASAGGSRAHLELRGAIRNLLNDAYQSSAGPRWVLAPGRHGSVTIVVAFWRVASFRLKAEATKSRDYEVP